MAAWGVGQSRARRVGQGEQGWGQAGWCVNVIYVIIYVIILPLAKHINILLHLLVVLKFLVVHPVIGINDVYLYSCHWCAYYMYS